jgi:hypothetical protein
MGENAARGDPYNGRLCEMICKQCLVCGRELGSESKNMPAHLSYCGLAQVWLCSRACSKFLHGKNCKTGKGLLAMQRYEAFASSAFGTTLRVGALVTVRHDNSLYRCIEAGSGVVQALRYDPVALDVELTVAYTVGARVVKVWSRGVGQPNEPSPHSRRRTVLGDIPTDSPRRAGENERARDKVDDLIENFAVAADSQAKRARLAITDRDDAVGERRKSDEKAADATQKVLSIVPLLISI